MIVDKKQTGTLLLAGMSVVALYLCYLLFLPYSSPILFASVIAIAFFPLHTWIRRFVSGATVSAMISTLATLLLTVIPLTFLSIAISNELSGLYRDMTAHGSGTDGIVAQLLLLVEKFNSWASRHFPVPAIDLHAIVVSRIEGASAGLLRFGASLVSNVFLFIANAGIAVLVLFFLFRDGESAVSTVMRALPLDESRQSILRARVSSTVITNFYGNVVVGALQGTLTGLSFWILGIDSPALWGVVTGIFSLIPFFGSAIVWVPASIALFFAGHYVKAMILLGLGVALISTIDNIVRPLIIHRSLHLHPILVFVSLLGGVQMFGVLGLFVGPIILSVAAALLVMLMEDLSPKDDLSTKIEGQPGSSRSPAVSIDVINKR
jgi:predicted PurR-regulated permease PerM